MSQAFNVRAPQGWRLVDVVLQHGDYLPDTAVVTLQREEPCTTSTPAYRCTST